MRVEAARHTVITAIAGHSERPLLLAVLVFLQVGEVVAIRVGAGIGSVQAVEPVAVFPAVGHAIVVIVVVTDVAVAIAIGVGLGAVGIQRAVVAGVADGIGVGIRLGGVGVGDKDFRVVGKAV